MENSVDVVVAKASAFGVGLNESDVRIVIHYSSPDEITAYFQGIGRAGCDGVLAKCHLFVDQNDFHRDKSSFGEKKKART